MCDCSSKLKLPEQSSATRWGIVCAGKISNDFVSALSLAEDGRHQVMAVAARDLKRAEEFAERHRIPKAFGDYSELAKENNIDVIYIGSLIPYHLPLAELFIKHGRSVLVEKPLCSDVNQTKQLIATANEHKVFAMEALWSRFIPSYQRLKQEIDSGNIGEVLHVDVTFGQRFLTELDRFRLKDLGGGVTPDIGIYCINLISLIYGDVMPSEIKASGFLNQEERVDESASVVLAYDGGRRTGAFTIHSRLDMPNEGFILGTEGSIKIESPMWSSNSLVINGQKVSFNDPPQEKSSSLGFNFINSQNLIHEADEVRQCHKQGLLQSSKHPLSTSLLLAEIIEAIRKQIGVDL